MMFRILIIFFCCAVVSTFVSAESATDNRRDEVSISDSNSNNHSVTDMRAQIDTPQPVYASNRFSEQSESRDVTPRAMLKQREQQRQTMMDEIKKRDPDGYARMQADEQKRKKIEDIIIGYKKGTLNASSAKHQLLPLIKDDVNLESFSQNVDAQIARLESQLRKLKKQKADPQLCIDEALNRRLGIPDEDEKQLSEMLVPLSAKQQSRTR
jgi:hypothetical protein